MGTPGWTSRAATRRVPDLSSRRWNWIVCRSGQRLTNFRKAISRGKPRSVRHRMSSRGAQRSALASQDLNGECALSSARFAKRSFGSVSNFCSRPFWSAELLASQSSSHHSYSCSAAASTKAKFLAPLLRKIQKFAKYCIDICRSFLVDDGESTTKMA